MVRAALDQAIAEGDQLALHALCEARRIVFTLMMRITANQGFQWQYAGRQLRRF
jgi:hypothetical protein